MRVLAALLQEHMQYDLSVSTGHPSCIQTPVVFCANSRVSEIEYFTYLLLRLDRNVQITESMEEATQRCESGTCHVCTTCVVLTVTVRFSSKIAGRILTNLCMKKKTCY
jgi:hypothetical protein